MALDSLFEVMEVAHDDDVENHDYESYSGSPRIILFNEFRNSYVKVNLEVSHCKGQSIENISSLWVMHCQER